MAMNDELKTVDLSGTTEPEALYDLWFGRGSALQRIHTKLDGVAVFGHQYDHPPGQWSMSLPAVLDKASVEMQVMQLLGALHDHCNRLGLVEPRTWKTILEQRATPPAKPGLKEAGRKTVKIPLNAIDAPEQVQKALGGLMAPGIDGKRIVETLKEARSADAPSEVGHIPE